MRDSSRFSAVLDTNIFISGTIRPNGNAFQVRTAWQDQRFELVTAGAQVLELIEVLQRPRFATRYGIGAVEIDAIVTRIEASATFIAQLDPSPVEVRDPEDAVILSIAISGSADMLVTGDEDL